MAKYCEKCGNQVSDDASFCKHCGQKQNSDNLSLQSSRKLKSVPSKAANESKNASNSKKIIIGLLAVIALFSLIMYQYVNNNKLDEGIYLLDRIAPTEEAKEEDFMILPFEIGKGLYPSDTKNLEQISIYLDVENRIFRFSPRALETRYGDEWGTDTKEEGSFVQGTFGYDKSDKTIHFAYDNKTTIGKYSAGWIIFETDDGSYHFKCNGSIIPVAID